MNHLNQGDKTYMRKNVDDNSRVKGIKIFSNAFFPREDDSHIEKNILTTFKNISKTFYSRNNWPVSTKLSTVYPRVKKNQIR